jgi:hypothetical protein
MPHFKCVPCRTRLYSQANPPDQIGDLCPDCGSLLEPADNLAELVGFRSIATRDDAAISTDPDTGDRVSDQLESFRARRRAALAQARLDAERWIDDGGSFPPEAVAVALPPPEPHS